MEYFCFEMFLASEIFDRLGTMDDLDKYFIFITDEYNYNSDITTKTRQKKLTSQN